MKRTAIVIECVGIIVTSIGIGMELAMGGHIHLVTMTVGAVIIATGGMVWAKGEHKERKNG